MRTPIGTRPTKAQAREVVKAATQVFSGVKKGAKKLGGALVRPLKWAGRQIEKEWRGEDEHIEEFRRKQKQRGLIK